MRRVSVYLDEQQVRALDELAYIGEVSRSALIRQLVDRAIAGGQDDELAEQRAAIRDSFGVLRDQDDFEFPTRGPDERSRHLDRMWQLRPRQ